MPGLPPHKAERAALCDLLDTLGPDVPTLCEGWNTVDMAAHLVVREHKPVASLGIVLSAAAGLHGKAISKAKAKYTYDELVTKVRNGPPIHWKFVDALFNTNEYFVHHEDVRRGAGDTTPRPHDEIADVEAVLWKGLERGHRMATRGIKGVRVELTTPDGAVIHSGKGDDVVTITGTPGELILFLGGRKDAAHVELDGPVDALATVTGAKLGI
jgi:uncharacterized protein (TIGR03085 family)